MKPFTMWAGGKTRLLKKYDKNWFIHDDGTPFSAYYEPFLGGGSVFAWLHDNNMLPDNNASNASIILSDVNSELIGIYKAIRDDFTGFTTGVDKLVDEYLRLSGKADRKDWYYELRKAYWKNPSASTLFMLLRTGFNGIWQSCEDSHGLYATPAGLLNHASKSQIYNADNMKAWHDALQGVRLEPASYDDIAGIEAKDALIYLDPPYRGSFTTYGVDFDDTAQESLIDWARDMAAHGARVLLANREVEDDDFFTDRLGKNTVIDRFDITYTAGRRKKTESGYEAKPAREFLAKIEG